MDRSVTDPLEEQMSQSSNNSTNGGIGFSGLLAIVFITLKLLNKIDWSWWWVLSPIWIPISVIALIIFLWLVGKVVVLIIKKHKTH